PRAPPCPAAGPGGGGSGGPAGSGDGSAAAHSAQADVGSEDGLTSFGATMATWNARHHASAAYSNVTPQGGHVVEYTINTGTISIDAAIKRAKQELPSDSREVWSTQKGHCYQVELTSRT